MDWFIYHLVSDVLAHYSYGVQRKIFGYIMNKKCERIVANDVLWAYDIPSHQRFAIPKWG
jgi:hypothetical protein